MPSPSEITIDAQPGPQTKAAESDADILIYGGAAGGGKSWLAVYDLGKYGHVKGYGGIAFRRTSPELTGSGSIWSEMEGFYPYFGAVSRQSPVLEWRFSSGARVEARHLQHSQDVRQHQSKAYARICFDEACHFTSDQFWFLFSRLRTTSGVPRRFLLTCNPDPDSFVLTELIDWWIGADGYPIPERDGVKRYFIRKPSGEMHWADTREELQNQGGVVSVTFIASKVTDNQKLLELDKTYLTKLQNLPPILQARMLKGNWRIREGAGDMFQRGWFPRLEPAEARALVFSRQVRWWDRAATPMVGNLVPSVPRPLDFRARREGNPDWTRGLLAGLTRPIHVHDRGRIVLQDLASYRDAPGAIEAAIVRQAQEDGPRVLVGLWVDPAQAGLDQAQRMKRILNRKGIGVVLGPQVKSKREYATLPSQLAYSGELWVVGNDLEWAEFFNEIESFPPALGLPMSKRPHDDCVDVLSGVVMDLDTHRVNPYAWDSDIRDPNRSIDHKFFHGDPEEEEGDDL